MDLSKFFLFLSAMVVTCVAIPPAKNAIVIGDIMYFSDSTETRTRQAAVAFCEEQGGELAKVWNQNLYNQLRLSFRQVGPYWIDGIDRADPYRFEMNHTCSFRGEYWNFWGMPAANLNIPAISCLTLVKGATAMTSKLTANNCNEEQFTLCQYPLEGCGSFPMGTT